MMYIDFYVFFISIFFIALGLYSLIVLGMNTPESFVAFVSIIISTLLLIFSLFRILKKHGGKGR